MTAQPNSSRVVVPVSPAHDADAPAPRLAVVWAALVYAAASLTLAWPALMGRFLVSSHSDQYIAGYPFREFGAEMLRKTGAFPLWNPYQFGGMPFVAAMHGDIFYPTFLLRMILPTDVAMTWGFIIHVFLAGVFAFIFLRRVGFGFGGSLVGGLAYMMGGQVASLVSPGHDGKIFVSALFPLLLWALLLGVRDGRRWAWGLVGIVVGLDVLSPHPQLLQYSLLASGAYALFLAIREARAGRLTSREAIVRLVLAFGGVVLGALIGAIQYLPVREYVAWSPRAAGIGDYANATSFGWNPQELFNVYLPEFTGILDAYWGPNGIHFHSEYVGAAVLVLAGAAFGGWRSSLRRSDLSFWTIAIVVTVLWSLGAHTPFYKIPYYLVPGTKFFRAPATVFFVGTLGITVLVAEGVDRILRGDVRIKYVAGWAIFAALIALLAVTGGLTNFAQSIAPEGRAELVDANTGALTIGAIRSLIFVLLAGAVIVGIQRRKISQVVAVGALVAICTADLWSVIRHYWGFSPPASQLYADDAAIDFLRKQPQPVRVLPIATGEGGDRATYSGAGLMVHKIRSPVGYHGNQIGRYNELVGTVQGPQAAMQRLIASPNLERLTNTQFILTDTTLPALAPQLSALTLAFGPVKDSEGRSTYVYRLPVDAPFAWVAPVIVKAPDEAVASTLLSPQFDVTRAALFDTAASVTGQQGVKTLPEPLAVRAHVDSYEPGHIRMTLDTPAPAGSALLAAENYYPGWLATVDGKPGKIGRAEYSLIGVELPAGARKIDLDFTSPEYERGKMVTLIALAVSILVTLGGLVTERRRSE